MTNKPLWQKILDNEDTPLDHARNARKTKRALSAARKSSRQDLALLDAKLVMPEKSVESNVIDFRKITPNAH